MVKTDKKNSKRYPAVIMAVIMAVSPTALAGCGGIGNSVQEYADDFNREQAGNASDRESPEADSEVKSAVVEPQRPEEELSTENTGQTDGEASAEVMPQEETTVPGEPETVVIPVLPSTGESLADFVAEGWQLLDSVELDFNGDGITDYVGVQAADWEVRSVEAAEGIELAESLVEYPTQSTWFVYDDGDCALYTFKSEESGPDYIAMYCRQDRKLTVVAEADPGAESLNLYKDSIYYVSRIVEEIRCRSVKEGKECIEEREYAVGVRLNRVNTDGTGQETVFEYRYPGTEQEILEKYPPYMSIIYEIGRDEIVLEVYIGKEPHPFYRMNPDGTGLEKIGQVPKE